jgi:hypothetical protein
LNGTLNVKLIKGFVPAMGFSPVKRVSGEFATVDGLKINSSEHFDVNYNGTPVTLKVVSGRQRLAAEQHRNSLKAELRARGGVKFSMVEIK